MGVKPGRSSRFRTLPNVAGDRDRDDGNRGHWCGCGHPPPSSSASEPWLDRFAQIAPEVIFVADGYRFAGKNLQSRRGGYGESSPSCHHWNRFIWLPYLAADSVPPDGTRVTPWLELVTHPAIASDRFHFERVGHGHPVWIVFSSGTTGLPKPIVHSPRRCGCSNISSWMHFHHQSRSSFSDVFLQHYGWIDVEYLVGGPADRIGGRCCMTAAPFIRLRLVVEARRRYRNEQLRLRVRRSFK